MKKVNVVFHNRSEQGLLGQLMEVEKNKIYFEFSSLALQNKWNLSPYKVPLQNGVFSDFPDFLYYLPGFIADSLPDGWLLFNCDLNL
ncbi:MAG: HipA N-terminal domain-containing protein [Pseudobdellovibrionaceae bacterium]